MIVLRLGQGDPHSISRVGAVGDDVLPLQPGHAWVSTPNSSQAEKRAVLRRNQKGLWIGGEAESVGLRAKPMMDRPVRRWSGKA